MKLVTIRASALRDLMDCPARFEAKHIQGRRMPKGGKAQLGTAIHKSTAQFDSATLSGNALTPDDCAGTLVDSIHHPEEDVVWTPDELKPAQAEAIGLALHKRYCEEIAPTQDYAAVEIQCERLELSDIGIALTGTTDRVRKTENGFGISDLKTGGRAVAADGTVSTAGHAVQMGVYELLAEHGSGLPITEPARIVGMQTGKTERGQRIGTAEVHSAREMLVGTPDSPGLLEHASKLVHMGIFFGNPNSMLCHEKYCPIFKQCQYRR